MKRWPKLKGSHVKEEKNVLPKFIVHVEFLLVQVYNLVSNIHETFHNIMPCFLLSSWGRFCEWHYGTSERLQVSLFLLNINLFFLLQLVNIYKFSINNWGISCTLVRYLVLAVIHKLKAPIKISFEGYLINSNNINDRSL